MKYLLIFLLLTLPALGQHRLPSSEVKRSPDGTIEATLHRSPSGLVSLAIVVEGQPFLTIDSIGIVADKPFALRWGVSDHAVYFQHYSEATDALVLRETTRYRLPSDGMAYHIPGNFATYEFLTLEEPLSQVENANTPFTFRLANGLWGNIHEAFLDNFPELTLWRRDSLVLGSWLCPSADATIGYANRIHAEEGIRSSYRVVNIARSATDLVNQGLYPSDITPDPCCFHTTLRPLKYIGIWWGMHLGIQSWTPGTRHGATTDNILRYIDFAARNHIDAVLFEGWNTGWDTWGDAQSFGFTQPAPDVDLDRICRYAQKRGVEVIIHHETGGNLPSYEDNLDSIFRWCLSHGIHAIKTGYAGGLPNQELRHSLVAVNHYNAVMRKAADYGIMLDVHEPIKPTGWNRVYPNLMTGEAVRGMEWNAWSEGNPPQHHTILPFTRGLAGPMDYTPGTFDILFSRIQGDTACRQWNMMPATQCRVHTTLAHQMALWVVLDSPWQMASDMIENYKGHPMFRFFKDFDADNSRRTMLQGVPGQYVVTLQQTDKQYFIGAITNEEARTITLPLSFLPEGHRYRLTLYADAPTAHYQSNPTAYTIIRRKVSAHDTLTLPLAPGGGCAIEIH